MNIDKIKLVLENCEVIEIPGKYIRYILVDKIKPNVIGVNGIIVQKNICRVMRLSIDKNANKIEYHPYGTPEIVRIFDRLMQCDDICSVEIQILDNDETYKYNVQWSNKDTNTNRFQDSVIDKDGNLQIIIDKRVESKPEKVFKDFC